MTNQNLAQTIDHTLLRADATEQDIRVLCAQAKEYQFFSVCINPCHLPLAQDLLAGSNVKLCTVIGFPLGATTTEAKLAETLDALTKGASEIDMVMNIGAAKDGRWDFVTEEIQTITDLTHGQQGICKVIVETALLDQEQKQRATQAVIESGADFIKTSTGFSHSGADVEDIKLFKQISQERIKIKASGGIRSRSKAIQMLEAGADRLGTSSGIVILQENQNPHE